jgi:hypothetical protein
MRGSKKNDGDMKKWSGLNESGRKVEFFFRAQKPFSKLSTDVNIIKGFVFVTDGEAK